MPTNQIRIVPHAICPQCKIPVLLTTRGCYFRHPNTKTKCSKSGKKATPLAIKSWLSQQVQELKERKMFHVGQACLTSKGEDFVARHKGEIQYCDFAILQFTSELEKPSPLFAPTTR
jgi:hypothetical protein